MVAEENPSTSGFACTLRFTLFVVTIIHLWREQNQLFTTLSNLTIIGIKA